MKNFLLVVLSAALISLGTQSALAQARGGDSGMGMNQEKRLVELIEQLDITAEQEPEFRAAMAQLNEQRRQMMRAQREAGDAGRGAGARSQDGADDERRRGERGADRQRQGGAASANNRGERGAGMVARQERMQQLATEVLSPVLSAAQLEKYHELEKARMAKMMERRSSN